MHELSAPHFMAIAVISAFLIAPIIYLMGNG